MHRSQSALEYMMTYGWAILIIVIVAAVLYSFGIFNPPSSVQPVIINGFSGVKVTSAAALPTQLDLQLFNNVGESVRISAINVTSGGKTYTNFACQQTNLNQGAYTICEVTGVFSSTRAVTSVNIEYISLGVFQVPYISSGNVNTQVSSYIANSAFSTSNNIAYVGSWSGALAEINTTDNKVITVIGNPMYSWAGITISANGSLAYIADDWTTLGVFKLPSFRLVKKYWTNGCGNDFNTLSPNQKYDFIALQGCNQNSVDVVNLTDANTFGILKQIPTQSGPDQLITASNGDVYTANCNSQSVSVINPTTLTNIANITGLGIGNGCSWRLVYNPVNGDVYIPSGTQNFNNISVVSTSTNSVIGNITGITAAPQFMTVSQNGKFIYISDSYDYVCCGVNQGMVSVMNASSYKVIKNIAVGNVPLGITTAPNGYIYVVNSGSNTISVINNNTLQIVSTISGNGLDSPQDIVITNGDIYVSNWNGNDVSVFSLSTYAAVTTISTQSNPSRMGVSPSNSSEIYVTDYNSGTVSVIDATTNAVSTIGGLNCNNPDGVAFTPNGQYAYIACWSNNAVSVINAVTNTYVALIGSITNNNCIRAITASKNGQYIYAGGWCAPSSDLTMISTATNSIVKRVPLHGMTDLSYLMMSPGANRLFALFHWWGENSIEVFNPTTLQMTATVGNLLNLFCNPNPIAASPNGKFLATADSCNAEPTVSLINLTSGAVMFTTDTQWGNINYVTFSPNSQLVYVSTGSATFAINVSAGNVQYEYSVGNCPGPITVSNNGTVYQTFSCQRSNPQVVSGVTGIAILSPTLQLIRYVYGPGIAVSGLATTPSLSKVIILGHDGDQMTYLSTLSNSIPVSPLWAGDTRGCPNSLALDGNIAYVTGSCDWQNGSIAVVNISTSSNTGQGSFSQIMTIQNVGSSPQGITISTNGQYVYVASSRNNFLQGNGINNGGSNGTISIISTATNRVIGGIVVPGCPQYLKATLNGKYILATTQCLSSNSLLVINPGINSVIKSIPLGGCPTWVTANTNGTISYVVNPCSNQIDVINLTSLTEVNAVGGGGLNNPQGIALTPDGKYAYIANWNPVTVNGQQYGVVSVLNTSAARSYFLTMPHKHIGHL